MRRLPINSQSVSMLLLGLLGLFLLLAVAGWLLPSTEVLRIPAPADYQMPQDLTAGRASDQELQQVLERPLFWPTRRPLPEAVAEEEQAPAASIDGIRVAGVILRGPVQTALFQTGQGVVRARVGETVSGWRVEALSASSVRLTSGDRSVELDVLQPRGDQVRLEPVNP